LSNLDSGDKTGKSQAWIAIGLAAMLAGGGAFAQVETDIRSGDGIISAVLMGEGEHVVVALHGGGGTDRHFFFLGKGGRMGQKLAGAGFRVIAISWSGQAGGGFSEVGRAIAYARETGARKISLMGHSRGGELAASYARQLGDGVLDTVIQFSSADGQGLPMTRTKKLFVFNKYDPVASWQSVAFDRSVDPRQKLELGGNGHSVGELVREKPDLARDVVRMLGQ
jgi:pimeloyl-ACP methyl ester carboxylesterase